MTVKRERETENTAYAISKQFKSTGASQQQPFFNLRLNDTETFLTNLNKCVVTFFSNLIGIADYVLTTLEKGRKNTT
jgi:hypothetical protein